MIKRLLAIVAIAVIHFAAVVFFVETGRTAFAVPLALPLVPVASWLGLTSSATAYGTAWTNSLFCGYVIFFAVDALASCRRRACVSN
jgi:hypothetical protein